MRLRDPSSLQASKAEQDFEIIGDLLKANCSCQRDLRESGRGFDRLSPMSAAYLSDLAKLYELAAFQTSSEKYVRPSGNCEGTVLCRARWKDEA